MYVGYRGKIAYGLPRESMYLHAKILWNRFSDLSLKAQQTEYFRTYNISMDYLKEKKV